KSHHATDNAYVWNCVDYSENTAKQETLCVKFKTSDQAKNFENVFNDAKKINENIIKKKDLSNEQKVSKPIEEIKQSETKPSVTDQQQQKKSSTTNKPASVIGTEQKHQSRETPVSSQHSVLMPNTTPAFKFGNVEFPVTNGLGGIFPSVAVTSGGFQFGAAGITAMTASATKVTEQASNNFRFGGSPVTTTANGFSGLQFGMTSSPTQLFKTSTNYSLADLKKQMSNNDTTSGSDRVFPGQGMPVFGSTPKKNDSVHVPDENDEDVDESEKPYEPSGSFQQVVLSPVEVRTGTIIIRTK
ncbi:unnamed protein product, partial [Didymodactylos carnosus]